MSDVQFNGENQYSRPTYSGFPSSSSGMVGLVIKSGLARDTNGANKVLIGVAVGIAVIAIIVFWKTVSGPSGVNTTSTIPPTQQTF